MLSKPEPGEPLFLYLAVTEVAVSAVLVRELEKEQRPVYYVRKSLLPAETRYTSLEKLLLALVAKKLKQKFKTCKLKQIPKDQNVEADALATLGVTFKPTELSSIPIVHMLEPSIQKTGEIDRGELEDQQDEVGVQTATEAGEDSQLPDQPAIQADDWDWRTPYLDWLRHIKVPYDKKEVRAFRVKASRFILIDDTLFRKSLAGPYLRCLDKEEAQTVLHALHSGECGNHAEGRSLFDIPSEIICDNGSQFISNDAEGYCARWNITLKKSAPRTPKSNGQAVSSNKIIMDNLRRRYGCMTGELNKAEMVRSLDTVDELRASQKYV
ncbi:uncharacterized protein LOC141618056 [Silene latifolia]|uniref:uncharacterized protein LOC141618056 n=1 Tax=Silene latifolia TaxID=37657 RepID=UPI003D778EF9